MPKREEHIFKCIEGIWRSITAGDSAIILCDFLDTYSVTIDEHAQFVRIIRDNLHFEFRAYGGRIRINITYV